jgi:hypothetical protein
VAEIDPFSDETMGGLSLTDSPERLTAGVCANVEFESAKNGLNRATKYVARRRSKSIFLIPCRSLATATRDRLQKPSQKVLRSIENHQRR